MREGDLVVDDACRTLMVVDVYIGLYGRAMADCVRADADIMAESACEYWAVPLGYFADELSVIIETEETR